MFKLIYKAAAAGVLSLGFSAAAVAVTAAPAAAVPSQCSISYTATSASSLCQSGTGEHRILCIWQGYQGAGPIWSVGPWRPVGSTSSTWCPQDRFINAYIETR